MYTPSIIQRSCVIAKDVKMNDSERPMTLSKTQKIIAYISQKHPRASITVLMKLCYLIDLVNYKRHGEQMLEFTYLRYTYGPFDQKIYADVKDLLGQGLLTEGSEFTPTGDEFTYYIFNTDADLDMSGVDGNNTEVINEVLQTVNGYGAKVLTEICYKTKPMVAFNATLGGKEHLNEKLDLSLVA
jgi:uncharacterized phage-associated protein